MVFIIEIGIGNNYVYIDKEVQLFMVVKIIVNVKVFCFFVCNVVEILLIYFEIVFFFLLVIEKELVEYGVFLCVDVCVLEYLEIVVLVEEVDWDIEYLDYIFVVKVVDFLSEVIVYIN